MLQSAVWTASLHPRPLVSRLLCHTLHPGPPNLTPPHEGSFHSLIEQGPCRGIEEASHL